MFGKLPYFLLEKILAAGVRLSRGRTPAKCGDMSEPLKTLFLLEDLCYGGTQKQNLALAARLDRKRFWPHILTLTGPTDLDDDARGADIVLHHLGAGRKAAPLFFVRLGRVLKDLKPDIIVCCTALPNIWGRLWGRKIGIPLIIGSCRGGGAPRRQHERLLWRLAHGMVCNSQPLTEIITGYGMPGERICHIANGVDTDHFRPAEKVANDQNIVCVARLAADKDHQTLIRAFAAILPRFPQARLRLVGEGPEERKLRQLAAQCGAGSGVEFLGACADPAPCLRQGAIFALASQREGLPNAILEAMACGLPVCATNVGGIPSLVADNGLLCAPGDIDALASNLAQLLDSAEKRTVMGRRGRQKALDGYSFAAMVEKHQEFFLRLWRKKRP